MSPGICRRLPEQQPRFYMPKFWAFFVTPRFALVQDPSAEKNSLSWLRLNLRTKKLLKYENLFISSKISSSLPRKFRPASYQILKSASKNYPVSFILRAIFFSTSLWLLSLVLLFLLYWSVDFWTNTIVSSSGIVSAWPHTL